MEPYTFHEGRIPPGISLEYEPALFNAPEFLSLRGDEGQVSFHILSSRHRTCVAGICFYVRDGVARSPLKASFGSLEFSDALPPQVIYLFLGFVEDRLRALGAKTIHVTNPPRAYAPEKLSTLETFLLNRGFSVAGADLGMVVPVSEVPYLSLIRHSEVLRRKSAEAAGFRVDRPAASDLGLVYDFIARCHAQKGYELSITKADLEMAALALPGSYVTFATLHGEKMVAASVAVRVRKDILYNFLLNHDKSFNPLSPTVPLLEGMYNYCREQGIALLDLGTSAFSGQPNFSLLDFKLHMGGVPASKLSFKKSVS